MAKKKLDKNTVEKITGFQKNEITEYNIYQKLSEVVKDNKNSKILKDISKDEHKHYKVWKKYTGKEVEPNKFKILWYCFLARIFGFTFSVQLMEKGEESAQEAYAKMSEKIPEAEKVVKDEDKHEKKLLKMLDEEKLKYAGSIVLGLNDALVELTGALAGLTLALRNTEIIALVGLITGIAASLSMGASEYLSTKTEEHEVKHPVKASGYTFIAYLVTVFILVTPYFIFSNLFTALGVMLVNAVIVILAFTFYISVAKDLSFKNRFLEMVAISLGVAGISFIIGYGIRFFLGIEV